MTYKSLSTFLIRRLFRSRGPLSTLSILLMNCSLLDMSAIFARWTVSMRVMFMQRELWIYNQLWWVRVVVFFIIINFILPLIWKLDRPSEYFWGNVDVERRDRLLIRKDTFIRSHDNNFTDYLELITNLYPATNDNFILITAEHRPWWL